MKALAEMLGFKRLGPILRRSYRPQAKAVQIQIVHPPRDLDIVAAWDQVLTTAEQLLTGTASPAEDMKPARCICCRMATHQQLKCQYCSMILSVQQTILLLTLINM